ncbi:uncharacterized protein [Branchiostoma lanceolatum]|uniref:uncharacterized protein n=1 Tax=Branchiostoma lanceolatum TaxID=7740 RepID=UPI003452D29A
MSLGGAWIRLTGCMLFIPYIAAVCPLVHYSPTSVDGYCYRKKWGQFDFHAAKDICAADGALLTTDKNPYRHMWLRLKDFAEDFWLGLQDEDVHGEYFWSDGEPLTEPTFWKPTIPEDQTKNCVISVRQGIGGVTEQSNWARADCHNYTTNVVCEMDNDECADPVENACDGEPNMHCVNTVGWYECECDAGYRWEGNTCAEEHVGPTEAPIADECPVGWDDSFAGMCIKAFDINANWILAHHTCGTKDRGRLVTIEDQDKLDFMIAYAGAPNYYWIGLNDVFDEGTLVWANGDELDPAEFTSGVPWNSDPNHQNTGAVDCVVFAKAILNGMYNTWAFEGCLTKLKFICEIDIDECKSKPCLNNGTCHEEHPVGYSCTCAPGFNGDHCENNIDDCDSVNCQNGGTCREGVNSYFCDCVPGYDGDHCENDIDDCDSVNCENGGTCRDGVNSYTCDCVLGYDGDHCENDIDDCDSVNCENGGTCRDGVNSYTCNCVLGYDGDHCENDIDDCDSVNCENGGTCRDGVNSYTCDCVLGYDGDHCENACPEDYVSFNRVCYKDFADQKTYDEARQLCAADGGLLAMPKDSATNTFIYNLGGGRTRWIGLNDRNNEGRFVFEDGQTLASTGYSSWSPGEPNDLGGEDCVEVHGSNPSWNDKACTNYRGFICQTSGRITVQSTTQRNASPTTPSTTEAKRIVTTVQSTTNPTTATPTMDFSTFPKKQTVGDIPVPLEVSIRPSEVQDLVVGETITITCHTARRSADYKYQWTVNGTVQPPTQRGPLFRYKAVRSGVHKVKCKVTSSGGETESEDSTLAVLPEGTKTFVSSIRITGRNFTPEMANTNSAAFKDISAEIKDWYRQALKTVQGNISIRVKDAKPGSVIASQNINVQDALLQDKDLYEGLFNALGTAVQTPSSLGMDPTSLTLLSASTCYGETVTTTDPYFNSVNLTFPLTAGDTHAYSIERCANNTESAGVPLAVRRCVGSFQTGVSWASQELLDCGLDLSRLAEIPVTQDNVAEVASELQLLTSIGSSLTTDNIADASTVLDNLANTIGDENVGYSVVVSIDQIMNTDDDVLYQSQVQDQSPSKIIRAIERFNDRVNLTTNRFRRIEKNIGVETYQIGAAELMSSVAFASLDDSEDLEDGSVRSYSKSSFIPNNQVEASIVLPAELASTIAYLKENISDPSDVEVRLSFIIYHNSRLFQSNKTASSSTSRKTRVNSRVIAGRVTGFEFKNLSNPVVTRYLPVVQNSTNSTVTNIRCVFWDFTAGGGGGDWSTEGCNFVGIDNGRVVCECNHLTNFAVLMDIYGGLHDFALDLISKIGIALSIAGLTLTLITYLIFKQLRQTRPQHILTQLCIALLVTLIIFLAGIDATNSPVGCTVVAFLLHYFLLAVFMWMAVEAFNMYLAFIKVLGAHVSKFLLKAAIFAWGLPFVLAIATLTVDVPSDYPNGQETYRSTSFCWLQGSQLYFGFLLPAGLVLLFNTIVYIMVISKLACGGRAEGKVADDKSGATKQNMRIAIAVMVLVGLTWIFGFFMISDGRVVFSYLFCIFNSLQGVFIFVFHTLRQKEVQNLWFKFCCACFVGNSRKNKSSTAKLSSNPTESNVDGYSREERGNAPEMVQMEMD